MDEPLLFFTQAWLLHSLGALAQKLFFTCRANKRFLLPEVHLGSGHLRIIFDLLQVGPRLRAESSRRHLRHVFDLGADGFRSPYLQVCSGTFIRDISYHERRKFDI